MADLWQLDMWEIERILLKNMESVRSDMEQFIKSDYFNRLDDTQKEIMTLKLEVVGVDLKIFEKCMTNRGEIGEKDYCELLDSTFTARKYLTDYQRKLLEDGDV